MNNCAVCGEQRELLTSGVAKAGAEGFQPLAQALVNSSGMGASVAVCEKAACREKVRLVR